MDPYNGWVIGYSADTLKQTAVLNFTPNGEQGAVWQSGAGPAADPEGNVYVMAANGTFDTTLNSAGFPSHGNFGNAFLKISVTGGRLSISDYFAMFNIVAENAADDDLGAGGPVVLPEMKDSSGKTRRLAVGIGKDRNIYLVDPDAMGKFNPRGNENIYPVERKTPSFRGDISDLAGSLLLVNVLFEDADWSSTTRSCEVRTATTERPSNTASSRP
jgi:hypothetical protein